MYLYGSVIFNVGNQSQRTELGLKVVSQVCSESRNGDGVKRTVILDASSVKFNR